MVAPERDSTRVNERIRVPEVRIIGPEGEQLGVMTPEDGMKVAEEAGLDLVEVAPNSRPPVCRIMDYGRYKYEQKKKHSGQAKKSAATLKEVKLRPGTDMHDLGFKLNNARRFLMEGDKVKITVMFRGREMVHRHRGRQQLNTVVEMLGAIAKVENPPRMEGRFLSMILVPDREGVAEAKKNEAVDAAQAEVEGGEESAADAGVEEVVETGAEKAAEADTEEAAEEEKEG